MRTLEQFLVGVRSPDGEQLKVSEAQAKSDSCPACGAVPARRPKRKTACKQCRVDIYVRKGALVLAEEALILDEFFNLAQNGARAVDLVPTYLELEKSNGVAPRAADLIWSIYNRLLLPASPRGILGRLVPPKARTDAELCQVYLAMAGFLRGEGKDNRHVTEQWHTHFLRSVQSDCGLAPSDRVIRVIGVEDERQCEPCRSLEKRRMTISEALEELPAPRICTSEEGYCRCCYGYDPFPED